MYLDRSDENTMKVLCTYSSHSLKITPIVNKLQV